MEEKRHGNNVETMILNPPDNSPFPFTIFITGKNNQEYRLEVTGRELIADTEKTCCYEIRGRQHSSSIDLFEKLSCDFGLRLPQNKEPLQLHFTVNYNELLTKNIHHGMLYGYGDPAVLRVDEQNKTWYYLVTTSNDAPDAFPLCRSQNLQDWEFVNYIFPKGNQPNWAAAGESVSDYWAPEMHKVAGEYRLYFVARQKDTYELCIGMARSGNPTGPFVAGAEPVLKGNKIDPHIYVEDDNAFLYWKEDNNALWPNLLVNLLHEQPGLITELFFEKQDQLTASFIITLWPWVQTLPAMEAFMIQQTFIEAVTRSYTVIKKQCHALAGKYPNLENYINAIINAMRTPVFAQKLSGDGASLTGEKIFIMENDQPWEAHLVEGMWITKHKDRYYLFYSGNDFSTHEYGIGAAIGNSAFGPFKKLSEPILRSTAKWKAPGHPSVAVAPNGRHYLFLHAYPGKAGYKEFRALLSIPLTFEDNRVLIGEIPSVGIELQPGLSQNGDIENGDK